MALVRFLFILFVIYLIIRVFTRFLFRSYAKKMRNNFENQQQNYNQKKEGDVTIKTKHQDRKKIDKDEGDYVNFEEVD